MTFLATSARFLEHDLAGHPEHAGRLGALLAAFGDPSWDRLTRIEPDREATPDEVLAVHSRRLLVALDDAGAHAPAHLDPDTYVAPGSPVIARLAARLTTQAAERALRRDEPGLTLVRPPGHHATRDRSMGFCLLNNVAVAAQSVIDRGLARRVLVFDHDVHHGNGTQDIFYGSDRVLYQSFHLWPHYPGTGAVDETGQGAGEGFTLNLPLSHGDGDAQVRAALQEVFLPAARAFAPDLILVSAGYDSLDGDPLGGLRLRPPFFGEIAARLVAVCPRVVCVLEGGYQSDQVPLAAQAQAEALGGAATLGDACVPPRALATLARHARQRWPVA